ncbi:hypothetical protein PTI45_03329 [Paenibacillus nuruki]|uniref:Uncharacterized protein n=1 Tax=Paenibacillus nuruki TaxID=1886670 RepID=A0A1E3L0I8_9BACL|nr:hypothetical protein [Paenibacillus nuruki]ODP27204.1 hypothetical protein PTI45_03329 [Paenibacillus nuruki]
MKNKTDIQVTLGNVDAAFDLLFDGFLDLQQSFKNLLHEMIEQDEDNSEEFENLKNLKNKLNVQKNLINNIKTDLLNDTNLLFKSKIFMNEEPSEDEELNQQEIDEQEIDYEEISAIDRTNWKVIGKLVKIETARPNNGAIYSNNVPIDLFCDIVLTCIDQFERYNKETLRTSSINMLMKEKIIKESTYKKATNLLIYRVFQVMLKESIFTSLENMKRVYKLNKSVPEIKEWLDVNISKAKN